MSIFSHEDDGQIMYELKQQIKELTKYKAAVLWHYNQKGHDRCHDTDNDMYKMCGLPPRNKTDLPSREEFEKRCKEYRNGLYDEYMF